MSILLKAKAFLGFSLMLISFNAFSIIENTYLENIFSNSKQVNLLAEDIQILNVKKHLKLNQDQLSHSILLSEVPQQENPHVPNNFRSRIAYFTFLANHQALANIYKTLAFSNVIKNSLNEANTYFLRALDEYEMLNTHEDIAVISQNLSWLYYVNGDLDSSLVFSKNAISFIPPNNKALFGFLVWQNNILLAQGKARQVENEILNRGLMMATRSNKKIQEWEFFYQLGKSYLMQNKLVQAKWFFIQALTLSENFENKIPKIKSLLMLAKAKRRSNDYSLALQNLRTAQGLIQNSNKIFQIDLSKQFAEVYHNIGDKAKEQQYVSNYNRLKNASLLK